MNDERRSGKESADVFGALIGEQREITEKILDFLPYEHIERLCIDSLNAKFRICGMVSDVELRQFLDNAILGREDLDSLVNQFEKQFFGDFWEARLRKEFGLSVVAALDWHPSRAVSEWSGDAIKDVIDQRLAKIRNKISVLAQPYPDNDRRRALLDSPILGVGLARLTTFRKLYGQLYTSNAISTIPSKNFSPYNDGARLMYTSPQVSLVVITQKHDTNKPSFTDHVFLTPTATLLLAVEKDRRWSELLSTIPRKFIHYVHSVEARLDETTGNFLTHPNPVGGSEFEFSYGVFESSNGNASALFFNTNELDRLIIVFGHDAIWVALTERVENFGHPLSVSDYGDFVSILYDYDEVTNDEVTTHDVTLTREMYASVDIYRAVFSLATKAPVRYFKTQEQRLPTLDFTVMAGDVYSFDTTIRSWKTTFDSNVSLGADNWLSNAVKTLSLPLDFISSNETNSLIYDVDANAIVLRKLSFPSKVFNKKEFIIGYARFEFTNSSRKSGQNIDLSDYTVSFTKITYNNSMARTEAHNLIGGQYAVFGKDVVSLYMNSRVSSHMVIDLNTFSLSEVTKMPRSVFRGYSIPPPYYIREPVRKLVDPISIEQIYFYDNTVGAERSESGKAVRVESVTLV